MGNPIVTHKCTADPTALVVGDTLFLYTGRDEAQPGQHKYVMNEWLCFSSRDLVSWTEHDVAFRPTTFSWAASNAYASSVVNYKDKFYWFVSVTPKEGNRKAIGVAVSNNPAGPFVDHKGSPVIDGSMIPNNGDNFDPSVLIDDNGQAYIFWGKKVCYYARLSDDLRSLSGDIREVKVPLFEEGSHIHKLFNHYYFSYGYGFPEKVAYAMSSDINGPWVFMGILNELAGNCETNRPCIVTFKGRHFFFYHNGGLPDGGSHRRSVCVNELTYNADRTIRRIFMTTEGVKGV